MLPWMYKTTDAPGRAGSHYFCTVKTHGFIVLLTDLAETVSYKENILRFHSAVLPPAPSQIGAYILSCC